MLLRSLDLSNNPQMDFLFATLNPQPENGMDCGRQVFQQPRGGRGGWEVYYKSPDSFDDVGGDGWGDAWVDPWETSNHPHQIPTL